MAKGGSLLYAIIGIVIMSLIVPVISLGGLVTTGTQQETLGSAVKLGEGGHTLEIPKEMRTSLIGNKLYIISTGNKAGEAVGAGGWFCGCHAGPGLCTVQLSGTIGLGRNRILTCSGTSTCHYADCQWYQES